jgi:Peptidase S24-like
LPPEQEFRHGVRDLYLNALRTHRRHLAAARVQGDSMIDRGIEDGHVIVFQHSGFDSVEHNRILVVEKVGEEEGWGAWSLKRLIVEQGRSSSRNEFGDEIDWKEPVLTLRSHNCRINPWQLDGDGQYRIRGVLLRCLHPEEVDLMETESLQFVVGDEKMLLE